MKFKKQRTSCNLCRKSLAKNSLNDGGIAFWVIMNSEDKFTYGFSGEFKIHDFGTLKKKLKDGDTICDKCLKKHKIKYEQHKSVRCRMCNKKYSSCFGELDQGNSCATYYNKPMGMLYSSWGSKFDGDRFKIRWNCLKDVLDKMESMLMCDKCVKNFEKRKWIENDGNMFFDFYIYKDYTPEFTNKVIRKAINAKTKARNKSITNNNSRRRSTRS